MGIDELSGGHPCFMGSTSGIGDSSLMGHPSSIAVGFSSKRVFSYSIPSVFFCWTSLLVVEKDFFTCFAPWNKDFGKMKYSTTFLLLQ